MNLQCNRCQCYKDKTGNENFIDAVGMIRRLV